MLVFSQPYYQYIQPSYFFFEASFDIKTIENNIQETAIQKNY